MPPDSPAFRRVPGPEPGGVIHGIDVSSHQPTDLTDLITDHGAEHVVVKLYQRVELGGVGGEHSKAQIASALENGCSVGGYVWLYHGVDPSQQVNDVLDLADEAGIELPILWLDVEPYTDGSLPTVDEIALAAEACMARGVLAGIYTGKWVFERLGNPKDFAHLPLWHASYDGIQELVPVDYGGWTVCDGHQYSSVLVDQNVFSSEVVIG